MNEPKNTFEQILSGVEEYYTQKVNSHGPTPLGVDWNSTESQQLSFKQLLKVCDKKMPFSVNDYGCGYGALVNYLSEQNCTFSYTGFDISIPMIENAQKLHGDKANCAFYTDFTALKPADYTVASGIFNVKQAINDKDWHDYIMQTVNRMHNLSRKGLAFNILTSYADAEYMRSDLHYADPLFWFDYCKRNFSRFVSLIHDYPLYEFTILVRY